MRYCESIDDFHDQGRYSLSSRPPGFSLGKYKSQLCPKAKIEVLYCTSGNNVMVGLIQNKVPHCSPGNQFLRYMFGLKCFLASSARCRGAMTEYLESSLSNQ